MKIPFFKAFLAVIAVLFVAQVAAQPAAAQNYYVSTSGSDSSGGGTISSPWATISYASSHVGPGAVVHVQAGSYSGNVSTSSSGTSSAYITYEGDNANWQPVDCAQIAADHGDLSQCPHLLNAWDNSGDYVKIEGFDVTASGINGIYTQGNATIITENHVHDILPSTCNSTGGSGINLNGTNAEVTDNYVHNIGPYPSGCGYVQGIYFLQAGGYAYNNISFNNSGFGIQLWHYPSNIVLENNTIFNNASGGIVLGTDNSGVTVDYITVANNIVANNGGVGISEQGCCSSSTGIHNVYLDNLVYGNSGGAYSLQNGLTATGTVSASPDFVNDTGTASGDYHLQSGSPALGAATASGAPATDFDGNARPQNGRYDIGAYEYMAPATAALSVSPTVLGFSSTDVGSTSVAQSVTVTNSSTVSASLAGISISGADSSSFAETNNCGSSLAAGASCVINVKFDPQVAGSLTGTLNVTPSSGTALQVSLSGSGQAVTPTQVTPGITVNPADSSLSSMQSLSVSVDVSGGSGDPTPTGTVTVDSGSYASGATALTNGTVTITIPAGSLSVGSDQLKATYSPDSTSSSIYDTVSGSASVTVTKSGFSMSATPVTLAPGSTGNSTVTVSSSSGYAGTVSLACAISSSPAGATDAPTCSVQQAVTLSSSTTSGTAVVTVNSTGAASASAAATSTPNGGWAATGGAVFALLLLPWIPRKRRKWLSLCVVLMAVTALGGLAGCGVQANGNVGSKTTTTASPGTSAGKYTITVTGTGNDSAKTKGTTTFTVIVN